MFLYSIVVVMPLIRKPPVHTHTYAFSFLWCVCLLDTDYLSFLFSAAEAMQSMELPPPAHQRAWSAVLGALMAALGSDGDVSLWTSTLSTPLCRDMAQCLRLGLERHGLTVQVHIEHNYVVDFFL